MRSYFVEFNELKLKWTFLFAANSVFLLSLLKILHSFPCFYCYIMLGASYSSTNHLLFQQGWEFCDIKEKLSPSFWGYDAFFENILNIFRLYLTNFEDMLLNYIHDLLQISQPCIIIPPKISMTSNKNTKILPVKKHRKLISKTCSKKKLFN